MSKEEFKASAIRYKIKRKIQEKEKLLEELKVCQHENEDESIDYLYHYQIGKVNGIIEGLEMALGMLGYKKKLVLKGDKHEDTQET